MGRVYVQAHGFIITEIDHDLAEIFACKVSVFVVGARDLRGLHTK